ncbi:LysR family transcriptional regulator [Sphingomonas canadensis]|uniref:LysR family transcriptional regulator n=1 Tax=Sphingomonas canadensis TaxID=1219257 RepID=A0ABW3HGY5_9SPHN|nr:LysR family transcriptional regulator [Sphingomonas canadensis]MCW3838247.1 LysR family transcriptional regulator [Sphingomonas canadensis]
MNTLLSMRIFCTVAELRSFTATADRFNMAHSAVSKHVAMLERRLSARLLNRTSRHVSLTEVGAQYLEQARRILESIDEMEGSVRNTAIKPSGLLKISAPPWLVNDDFVGVLAGYRRSYPDVDIDIDIDRIERNASHEYGDLDIAIRITNTPGEGMIAQHLATLTFRLVATPAYLDSRGRASKAADVDGWPLLHYSAYSNDGTVVFRSGDRVTFKPIMRSSSTALLYHAVRAGIGPAFMPSTMVERDVAEGRLEHVLPEETASPMKLYAIYPRRPYVSAKVKSFLKFLETAYA